MEKDNSVNSKIYHNTGNKYVQELVPIKSTKTLLDVGCGAGSNAEYFQQFGILVDGVTLSKEEAQMAENFMRDVEIYNLENGLPSMFKERKYDAIICSHVLEHICFPTKLLNDINNSLNVNGLLVIALPNLMHYKSRTQLLKGNFYHESSGIWDNTHFKWYTFRSAKELLKNNNFSLVTSDVEIVLPLGRITKKFPKWFKNIFKFISPGLFGWQLLYVAKRNNIP